MKTVIVTGCSRGIGQEIAKQLSTKYNFRVMGTSTSGNSSIVHTNFHCFKLDLSNSNSINEFSLRIRDHKIDVLINCAGVLLEKWDESKINMSQLKSTFAINVFGLIELTENIIPNMNKGGHIINFSSGWGAIGGTQIDEFVPHYKLSKVSVNMYTRILASRLLGKIKVSVIDPGWVKTDMGGLNANRKPAEVVPEIIHLLNGDVLSGMFWKNGKTRNW